MAKSKFTKGLIVLGSVATVGASNAMAAATLTAPTFAMDDVAIVAGALATGLAAFWAIKKGISLIRA